MLRRTKKHGATGTTRNFTPEAAIQSLHTSLRELRTDWLDVLFLHEATLANAANASLLQVLQRQVAAGTVRSLSIASDFGKLGNDASLLPPSYEIVQCNDNATERKLPRLTGHAGRTLIMHSIFKPARQIQEAAVPIRKS